MRAWIGSLKQKETNEKKKKKSLISAEDLKTDYKDLLDTTLWDDLVGKLSLW